ncbi:hypothetical protein A2U01_0052528, partial [Trifolium medium]|nr:hypothetical protein [Trifolium medium]
MVRGREIRFDREAINAYLRTPFQFQGNEQRCAFQKHLARGNWDIPLMTNTLLRENGIFELSASGNPLRVLRDEMKTFTQLLLLLVLHNIQPRSHTSDATTNIMGLIFYIHQGLEVDLAGVIASEMKNIVESGIRPGKLKPNCQLGFPGLIM